MSVTVKICGITNLPDALIAAEAGADALGFVFYERSPRAISLKEAAGIISGLPASILKVGLFVNAPPDQVSRTIHECGLNLLQFHGDESPDYCLQFGVPSMKAFRLVDAKSLEALPAYKTHAWLLDSWSPDKVGGTGQTFNWDLAVQAMKYKQRIFLAGGLTPENVSDAIHRVHPYAVDVSSGVESAPGKKDPHKVSSFIRAAKSPSA
jgi:phosphoribosylanthranilate isomerase